MTMIVADLADWLERFAPARLAESWDNVGLLIGDPTAEVNRVMTCLTVTPRSSDEAIVEKADAIVSHHPVLFKPTKTFRADREETSYLWRLARSGVAILSPHTSFDNTEGGINDGLAFRLGLTQVEPLRSVAPLPRFKVVIFAPASDRERILASAFASGAGSIGDYRECSFGSVGSGTFFGLDKTNPTIGQAGRREVVDEWRLEVTCPGHRLAAVLAAIRLSHSYEEPAIDVYPIAPAPGGEKGLGSGRVGQLPATEPLGEFASRVARLLQSPGTQFVGDPDRPVTRVAICCGAGDDFLPDARRVGADVLLTGEARFHRALEADAMSLGLVVAGHHPTERPGVEDLARLIARAFPTLAVWASRAEVDPLRPALNLRD